MIMKTEDDEDEDEKALPFDGSALPRLTDDQCQDMVNILDVAREKVLKRRLEKKQSDGAGCNSKICHGEGRWNKIQIANMITEVEKDFKIFLDSDDAKKPELQVLERYTHQKKPDSMRVTMALREDGALLARQFGSLPKDLQKKFLSNPCFTLSYYARIQMYLNFRVQSTVTLAIHQDGVPANIVRRDVVPFIIEE